MTSSTETTTTLPVGDAYDAALTADRLLVSRAGGPLEIRDRSTHAVVASVPGGAPAGGLATSPDGSLAARLRRDGTVEVVDIARAGVLGVLGAPSQILYGFRPGLAFTPDAARCWWRAPTRTGVGSGSSTSTTSRPTGSSRWPARRPGGTCRPTSGASSSTTPCPTTCAAPANSVPGTSRPPR